MALSLPPPTPVTSACSGLTYDLPLPIQHISYEFTISSSRGPGIQIPINIPEIPIYIPFPKIFDKIPKIDTDCEKPRQDMIIPGVPCDLSTCSKKVCRRIFRRRFCINIPYPCPRFQGQIYLEKDDPITINLFKIPKLGLTISANSSSNVTMKVDLTSNTPIADWNRFLNSIGSSPKIDIKGVLDELIIAGKNTLGSLLVILTRYYVTNKIALKLSIKITKLIVDINWELESLKLYFGNKQIELGNLRYTFKNIDILQLLQADSIQLTFTTSEIVFVYVLGTFDLGVNPFQLITTMIKDRIAFIQSLPNNEQFLFSNELNRLKEGLDYIEKLTDVGELIPGLNKIGLNYIKKFLDAVKVKIVVSLRFCPLTATPGVCCTIGFDLTDYLNLLGEFLKNDVKDGLDFLKKYTLFTSVLTLNIPQLKSWNDKLDMANKQIIQGAGFVLDQLGNFLENDTQFYYGSATICAPV